MTLVPVVTKARDVAIAADTLVTFGNTRLSARLEASSTLLKMQGADSSRVVGRASTVALAGLTAGWLRIRQKLGGVPEIFTLKLKAMP